MATILVTGLSKYPTKAFQTKLIAYFQSKKKSGGGECSLSLIHNGDALVTFRKEEVLKNVLSRAHTVNIEGKDIPITVSRYEEEENVDKEPVQKGSASKEKPVQMPSSEPQEKADQVIPEPCALYEDSQEISDVEAKTGSVDLSRIFIKTVDKNFDRENLEFFIGCCCSDKDKFKICETDSDCDVIVEFSSSIDVAAVVQKINCKQKKKNIEARTLKRPQSIKLTQLSSKINKDHLELYFESKIEGNGPVEVEMNEKNHSAVIKLPHPEDVLRVMAIPHTIKGEDLKIHLYFDEVQLMTFTSTSQEQKEEDCHVMQKKSSEATKEPPRNIMTVTCCLKNEHCLQILKQHHVENEHPEVQLNFDTNVKNEIEITGSPSDVNTVQIKLLKIASQIESKTWQAILYYHSFLTKVEKEDFIRNIFIKSGINATYSCSEAQIKLYAISDEHLLKAEKALDEVLCNTEVAIPEDLFTQNIVKDLNRFLAEKNVILLKNSEYNIIQGEKLQHHFISPSDGGKVNKVVLVGYTDVTLEAKKMLADYLEKHCMTKIVFPLASAGVSECLHRFADLQSLFPNAKIEFEEEEDSFSLHVYVNSLAASETKNILNSVVSQVIYHKEELRRPGAVQFIEKNKPLLKSLETIYECVIHTEGDNDETGSAPVHQNEELLSKVILHKKFKVSVIKHSVIHLDMDAVLLPVEENLEFSNRFSKMISAAGGPQLQDIMKEWKQKEKIKIGSIHIAPAGQLAFKYIIFVVIPKWKEAEVKEEALKKSLLQALDTADGKRIKSIAIHPFDFEKSMSCLHQCSRILMMSLKEFCDANKETCVDLTDIRLVSTDDKCLSEMKTAQHHFKDSANGTSVNAILLKLAKQPAEKNDSSNGFQQRESSSQQQQREDSSKSQHGEEVCNYVTPEGINISLVKGNIGLQKSDVIVNTVSTAMNLTYGAVSKAILDQAGYKLQENTNQVKPTEVVHGAVLPVSTAGCKIACKEVYNTVCCQYDDTNPAESKKTLQDIIKTCLENAHNSGYDSITFPAIGTGNLRFPRHVVAEKFIEKVTEFGRTYKTTLTTVNVVVYTKDRDTLKAFDCALSLAKGIPQHELDQYTFKYDSDDEGAADSADTGKRAASLGQNQVTYTTGHYQQSSHHHHHEKPFTREISFKSIRLIVKCGEISGEPADAHVKIPSRGNVLYILQNNTVINSVTSKSGSLSRLCAKVLDKCNHANLKTVCISVSHDLSSGVTMKTCVSTVLKAVEEFAVNNPTSCVTCVKLISTTPEIFTLLGEEASTKSQKSGGFWSALASLFTGNSSVSRGVEASSEGDITPVILKMYALNKENITKASEDVLLLLSKEFINKEIPIERDMFSEEDLEEIQQYNKDVSITFNNENSSIIISGFSSQICELQDKIITLSRTLQQKRTAEQEEKHIQEKVCWKFWKDEKWVDFNCKVNARLEKAYHINDKEVDFVIDGVYILFNMEHKMLKLIGTDIRICRRNPADEIPDTWDDADCEDIFRKVPLPSGIQEHQEIKNDFVKTFQQTPDFQVFELWRIQNPSLWRLYIAKRKEMNRLKHIPNPENILYHGTDSATCSAINAYGFNRSYCGKNATVWGDGTYFATSAKYSTVDTYSVPDAGTGEKWMYRARVLTGEFCTGKQGIKEPPVKDSTKSSERYDSVANKLAKPDLFVIFHDNQAYPEYLIKFKLK